MTNSLDLYRIIVTFIWQNGMRFHDLRLLTTFSWAIVGLLLSQQIHLSHWLLHRVGRSQASSKQRQLMRWLDNPKIDARALYRPLIRAALREWQGETLFLALDSSVLWDRFVIVRLSLVYRGRALPLDWIILEHGSATVGFETYKTVLEEAAKQLPKPARVVLLADRGFVDHRLFRLARDLGWHFRIRLKSSIYVGHAIRQGATVGELMPEKGHALFLHKIWITEKWFGPVHLALGHVKTRNGYEEWAILSDEPTSLKTFDEFGLRFDIEENFLDDKSAGFQLESSEIRDAEALSRLALILATTTLYLTSTGTAVIQLDQRRCVDTHWHRGLSYLQIGWRWVFHALAHGKGLFHFLCLDPQSDPEPVFASKAQAARPIAAFDALELRT
jgi:hypothetical protein